MGRIYGMIKMFLNVHAAKPYKRYLSSPTLPVIVEYGDLTLSYAIFSATFIWEFLMDCPDCTDKCAVELGNGVQEISPRF